MAACIAGAVCKSSFATAQTKTRSRIDATIAASKAWLLWLKEAGQTQKCSTMALEQRGSNFFYYEKKREGKRVVSVYAGCGQIAELNHQVAQIYNTAKAQNQAEFERQRRQMEGISENLDYLLCEVFKLADASLIAAGYHQHKRQWRKRRMVKVANIADKKAEIEEAKEAAYQSDITKKLQFIELTVSANKDESKAWELRQFIADNPDMVADLQSLAESTKFDLLKAVVTDKGLRILAEKEIDAMQERLAKGGASPIEQLMIDTVLLCWLRVQYAESFRTGLMRGGALMAHLEFAEKALNHAHNRYRRALTSLARLQKLTRQSGSNLNLLGATG